MCMIHVCLAMEVRIPFQNLVWGGLQGERWIHSSCKDVQSHPKHNKAGMSPAGSYCQARQFGPWRKKKIVAPTPPKVQTG